MKEEPKRIDIAPYQARVDKCNRIASNWKRTYAIVGVMGIGASAFAAVQLTGSSENAALASVIATICFGIMGFAPPMKHANNYDKAANKLQLAIDRYKIDIIDERQFLKEYENSLSITIGEGDYKFPVDTKPSETELTVPIQTANGIPTGNTA